MSGSGGLADRLVAAIVPPMVRAVEGGCLRREHAAGAVDAVLTLLAEAIDDPNFGRMIRWSDEYNEIYADIASLLRSVAGEVRDEQ